jgi:F-type H+-transporting ATPase subunit epsilon
MALGNTIHVEIVTAERELFNGEADIVSAPGSEGRLGILPGHAALLAMLAPGELRIGLQSNNDVMFVSGGFIEVSNNRVTVLADTAEHADEIDTARAEAARRRAEERLQEVKSDEDRASAQAALQRALYRLRVVETGRSRGHRRIEMPQSNN